MRFSFCMLIAAILVFILPPAKAEDEEQMPLGAHGLDLPASFTGVLPCADCPGVKHHLNLWPDQVFHLRQTYLEKNARFDDIGRWSVDPERQALILRGGREMPLQFEIKNSETLRKLDIQGRPIESGLPYELTSTGSLEPLALNLFLHGMFVYFADAARFTECLTGRSYPVAMEGDYIRLEQAYLEKRSEPEAPLLSNFEGQITQRPPMEGDGTVPTVVVDRFVNVWPNEKCDSWNSEPTLTNTYWRIVRLGDEAVKATPNRREPHLVLLGNEPRFSATVGCNQMIGGYETADEIELRFSAVASTMMACPPPIDETERQLGKILAAVRSYQMSGQSMELFDHNGEPVALLRAMYF